MQVRYQRENGTYGIKTVNDEPSKTDQSMKKMCDVNYIMSRYTRGGDITHLAKQAGQYLDTTKIHGMYEGMVSMHAAEAKYAKMPEHIKERFGSIEEIVNFVNDDQNYEEAKQLGLLKEGVIQQNEVTPEVPNANIPEESPGDPQTP